MAYITNYNFHRITNGYKTPDDKGFRFDDTIIWISPDGKVIDKDNPTKLFARWDVEDLLLFKAFCKDTELAVGRFYRVLPKPQDSYMYVQPEKAPSYHDDPDCPGLHAEFERVLIPKEIREQGIEKVIEFRQWWRDHEYLRTSKPDLFVFELNLKFNLQIRSFEIEEKGNSGVKEIENCSLEKINESIDGKFKELFSWAKDEKKRLDIFIRFAYLSYLGAAKDRHIAYNPTKYTEEEIKEVLRQVHPKKLEIIKDLQNLYVKTYNPNLQFDNTLLEQLGFEACGYCSRQHNSLVSIEL